MQNTDFTNSAQDAGQKKNYYRFANLNEGQRQQAIKLATADNRPNCVGLCFTLDGMGNVNGFRDELRPMPHHTTASPATAQHTQPPWRVSVVKQDPTHPDQQWAVIQTGGIAFCLEFPPCITNEEAQAVTQLIAKAWLIPELLVEMELVASKIKPTGAGNDMATISADDCAVIRTVLVKATSI